MKKHCYGNDLEREKYVMKIYEIIDEINRSHGFYLKREKAELKKNELDTDARNRGLNIYFNIYEREVIE